ncbi:hypothetical protein L210DRAFT_3572596 [Boletus edulis BED1]|uniref:Uncharacterized protein n=1 Tax=Boletus edulis BED1 TaxID=1328754 RepID=A0AAD4G6F8_BOLED|nr:hypothetical protein L210DRAFT_3572596 [Boletus edulis BED1]
MIIDADSDFDPVRCVFSGKSDALPSFSIASTRYHHRRSRLWLSMSTGKKVVKWFEAILPISSATGPGRIGAQGSRMLHEQDPIRRQDRAKYTTVSGKRSTARYHYRRSHSHSCQCQPEKIILPISSATACKAPRWCTSKIPMSHGVGEEINRFTDSKRYGHGEQETRGRGTVRKSGSRGRSLSFEEPEDESHGERLRRERDGREM